MSKKSCDYLLIFIKQKLRNSKFRKKVRIARYKCRIVKGKKFYPSTNRKKINMLNCSTHNTSNDLSYLTTARLQKKYREHHINTRDKHTYCSVPHHTQFCTFTEKHPKTFGIWIQTGSGLTHLQCITGAPTIFILSLTCTTPRASFNRAPPSRRAAEFRENIILTGSRVKKLFCLNASQWRRCFSTALVWKQNKNWPSVWLSLTFILEWATILQVCTSDLMLSYPENEDCYKPKNAKEIQTVFFAHIMTNHNQIHD